jgi:hypothetical protein
MRSKLFLKPFQIIYVISTVVMDIALSYIWVKGGPDWIFWIRQLVTTLALILFGLISILNKETLYGAIEEKSRQHQIFSDLPKIPLKAFFIFILLAGVAGFILTLRSTMIGCPAPGC